MNLDWISDSKFKIFSFSVEKVDWFLLNKDESNYFRLDVFYYWDRI